MSEVNLGGIEQVGIHIKSMSLHGSDEEFRLPCPTFTACADLALESPLVVPGNQDCQMNGFYESKMLIFVLDTIPRKKPFCIAEPRETLVFTVFVQLASTVREGATLL